MYKMIIVDDEAIIRNGLQKFINSEKTGFEVCATFPDGREAIEYIRLNNVDLVMTDIKMMEISGLELARYIKENMPHIKVVILSGYKEFDYAQKAIEFNVKHYLLKPTSFEEILKVLCKIKQSLDEELIKQNTDIYERQNKEEIDAILKTQLFFDLYMGALRDESEIKKRFDNIDKRLDPSLIRMVVINIKINEFSNFMENTWKYGKEKFYFAISNIIRDDSSEMDFIQIHSNLDELKIVAVDYKGADIRSCVDIVDERLKILVLTTKSLFNLDVTANIEKTFSDILNIPEKIYTHIDNEETGVSQQYILNERYKLLFTNLNIGNYEGVRSIVEDIFDILKDSTVEETKVSLLYIFNIIIYKYKEIGIEIEKIMPIQSYISTVIEIKCNNELEQWLKKTLDNIAKCIDHKSDQTTYLIIKNAREFIDSNFSKDISLEDVADYVFLSASYFSRLFKSVTGKNFRDYLIDLRMSKAIELLKENKYKIYEISKLVGYTSSNYFNRVFKLYTGYTPKDYCRKVINISGDIDED